MTQFSHFETPSMVYGKKLDRHCVQQNIAYLAAPSMVYGKKLDRHCVQQNIAYLAAKGFLLEIQPTVE